MRNVVLTGVGGQGTVLAAKILAQAAQARGWQVRTAETIGMSQRGGSVVSHVRMGDDGEPVASPLVAVGRAELIIAFEPGEGARVRRLLSPSGTLVTATRAVQPVTAALAKDAYASDVVLEALSRACPSLVVVDEAPLLARIGNAKALNVVLLAAACAHGVLGLGVDELKAATAACVKPRFKDMNLAAIDLVIERIGRVTGC